ncbi:MAG: hypothetical protein HBSAPP03_24690 [Phycisphaerae bacterium]|nr:MAG: hypothetical protein HBSAPP03_24690 [Phycisphaerae bacterium]
MNATGTPSCRPGARPGYSLVEMLLAISIMALVIVGAQTAVLFASRAVPAKKDQAAVVAASTDAMAMIADDLAVATAVLSVESHMIEFTVPDRTGDGVPDTIRVAWSGTPGDPLTWTVNGLDPIVLAPDIHALEFTTITEERIGPTTYTESAETVVASFTTATLTAARQIGKYSGDTYTRAQWFRPSLPPEAVGWSISRAQFTCRQGNNVDSVIKVQVRTQRNGEPTSRVLTERTVLETAMSATWRTMDVADLHCVGLRPDEAACLVFSQSSGNDYVDLLVQRSTTADAFHLWSINGGTSWTKPGESLVFTVWGHVRMPEPAATETIVRGIRYTVQVMNESTPAVAGRWTLFNTPVLHEESVMMMGESAEALMEVKK